MLKVAIIRAVAAELCCAHHITGGLKSFQVHVYEKSDVVGGTWVYSHEAVPDSVHSSVYMYLDKSIPD